MTTIVPNISETPLLRLKNIAQAALLALARFRKSRLWIFATFALTWSQAHATETWWIRGMNWADPRDNYVDGLVLPSGISASTTPSEASSKAGSVGAGFRTIGCNMVRLPINPQSVLNDTWWTMYQSLINRLVADGMHVMLGCWEGTAAKDGKIDNYNNWKLMWQRVDGVYKDNANVWFEPFNEPFGYSSSELITIYRDFLGFIAKDDGRIVLPGTGFSEDLSAIGGQFPNCKLGQHIYPWWGNYTTESAWQDSLNTRVAGYWDRMILTEFGAPATTGKNYGVSSSDHEIAFIRGITSSLRSHSSGSVYWPGVRDGDSYRLFSSSANMTVTNNSLRDRVQYGWATDSVGEPSLALNKPTTASSNENATNTSAKAVDGNTATRWSSLYSDPQWIRVDLQSTYSINRVKLNWETAYGRAYQIQVSNDDVNWTTIYSTTTGDGGIDDLTGLSGTGRYVRMYGTQRATAFGYSLWEFEVFGTTPGSDLLPTADAYVRDGTNAGNNYGTATVLDVKADGSSYFRKSYLKFDTSSASSVSAATLKLYVSAIGTDATRTISVYAIPTTTWGETTLTWNNAPAAGTLLGSFNVSNSVGVSYNFNVTSYVQSEKSAGRNTISLLLINNGAFSGQSHVSFASREAATGQPGLTITP